MKEAHPQNASGISLLLSEDPQQQDYLSSKLALFGCCLPCVPINNPFPGEGYGGIRALKLGPLCSHLMGLLDFLKVSFPVKQK